MATFVGHLTAQQLENFEQHGYLVIPDFIAEEQADHLKRHVLELIETQLDLRTHPRTVFSTKSNNCNQYEKKQQQKNEFDIHHKYFLDSADQIAFFFEADAVDTGTGSLKVPLSDAVNKIAHNLHMMDPAFRELSFSRKVKELAIDLGFKQPIVLQSMCIQKNRKMGAEVVAHRDSTFLSTIPSTATGLWVALEDCTSENGCLQFVPGSHRLTSTLRMIREGPVCDTINNVTLTPSTADIKQYSGISPINENIKDSFIGEDPYHFLDADFVSVPVRKGDLIVIHGEVVHRSTKNTSSHSRFIYTFHLIEACGTRYPSSNWLQSASAFPHLLSEDEENILLSTI